APAISTLFPYTTLFRSLLGDIPSYTRAELATHERSQRPRFMDLWSALLNEQTMRVINGIPLLSFPKLLVEKRLPKTYMRLQKARSEEHTSELQSLAYLV